MRLTIVALFSVLAASAYGANVDTAALNAAIKTPQGAADIVGTIVKHLEETAADPKRANEGWAVYDAQFLPQLKDLQATPKKAQSTLDKLSKEAAAAQKKTQKRDDAKVDVPALKKAVADEAGAVNVINSVIAGIQSSSVVVRRDEKAAAWAAYDQKFLPELSNLQQNAKKAKSTLDKLVKEFEAGNK
ncbi:uncharacterized protein LOC62_02G002627 [Vanrija pseudolonga]|uniref:SXP/RAL-2 family protein Ani s 5-like cation-binding domain-containing protein n=1 Tax=Vanrija pseudolonga TaxID=143232 RepID=A0AAF1BG28_9TREE|nr:hypothetical protein LOC62_02G002627 [Vanrija pseudolonga]